MDTPKSVASPFKSSSNFADPEKQTNELFLKSPGCVSGGIAARRKDNAICTSEDSIGVLEVIIHQARDIHNICIYHKQDVYAKLCLTSNPENAVSTKIINGGGKNPIFNENIRLNVCTVDASIKCEVWMLSRVKNYLEDQLLGLALVPLSEVLVKSGKLAKEFPLSSTDLFHSPAGFVHLSLSYTGDFPDVLAISTVPASLIADETPNSFPTELDKIEFPDPKIDNENDAMVSEYFGVPCANLGSQSSDSFSTDAENSEAGIRLVESFSNGTLTSNQSPKHDSSSEETVKEKSGDIDVKSNGSGNLSGDSLLKPIVTVDLEPEQKMVQQDIVDMYMKSMQEFTESLAKMKLPMDIDNGLTSSEDSTSDQKLQGKKNSGSRVFYGSRAFF